MAQARQAAVKEVVAAAAPVAHAGGVPELHHVSSHEGPSAGAEGTGNKGGTYGVLKSVGDNLGLNKVAPCPMLRILRVAARRCAAGDSPTRVARSPVRR